MSNFLQRFAVRIEHFTKTEIKAQAEAQALTTRALDLAKSGEAVTLSELTGTAQYLPGVIEVLEDLSVALNTVSVTQSLDDLQYRQMWHNLRRVVRGWWK